MPPTLPNNRHARIQQCPVVFGEFCRAEVGSHDDRVFTDVLTEGRGKERNRSESLDRGVKEGLDTCSVRVDDHNAIYARIADTPADDLATTG